MDTPTHRPNVRVVWTDVAYVCFEATTDPVNEAEGVYPNLTAARNAALARIGGLSDAVRMTVGFLRTMTWRSVDGWGVG